MPHHGIKLLAAFLFIAYAAMNNYVLETMDRLPRVRSMKKNPDSYLYAGYIGQSRFYSQDFSATLIDGSHFRLADHVGKKYIVLLFMELPCRSCELTLPEVAQFAERYDESEYFVLVIVPPGNATAVKSFIASTGSAGRLRMAEDSGSTIYSLFHVKEPPAIVSISVNGGSHERRGTIINADLDFAFEIFEMREELALGNGISKEKYLKKMNEETLELEKEEREARRAWRKQGRVD